MRNLAPMKAPHLWSAAAARDKWVGTYVSSSLALPWRRVECRPSCVVPLEGEVRVKP